MQKHSRLEHFAPVQLLPQHREVAVTRRVDKLDGMLRAPDKDAIALLKVALQLPVEMKPRVDRALQGDFDQGAVADHDRPIGQRVRAKSAPTRTRVRSVAGSARPMKARKRSIPWRPPRSDRRPAVIDELTVDVHHEFDQPTDRSLVHDCVVEGERRGA